MASWLITHGDAFCSDRLLWGLEWYNSKSIFKWVSSEEPARAVIKTLDAILALKQKPLPHIPFNCKTNVVMTNEWWRWWSQYRVSRLLDGPSQSQLISGLGKFYRIVKSPRREGKTLLILLNWWSETNPPAPDTTAKSFNFNNKEIISKC